MVENTGKKTGLGRIRPLNKPELVQVEETREHRPTAIISRGQRFSVISIQDMWEIVDEWWSPNSIARSYYQVCIDSETLIVIFRDLANGTWYKQQDRPLLGL